MIISNYDKFPAIDVSRVEGECAAGWTAIADTLNQRIAQVPLINGKKIIAVECYSGLHFEQIETVLRQELIADQFLTTRELFKSESEIDEIVKPYLGGEDPLFGYWSGLEIKDYLDLQKIEESMANIDSTVSIVIIFGPGASLCAAANLLIYADMPRWEGQLRQRRGEVDNLGVKNRGTKASLQYKRSYFVDWRALDKLKRETISRWDYLLDTTLTDRPKLVTGERLRACFDLALTKPFRVVPFFDPAPWGGQWMKEYCDLDRSVANYGWCFDCVPEENSLLLNFGDQTVELPSVDLLYYHPKALLGDSVFGLFGAEFPIRFDFLDTIGGGNLSLQVHPLVEYIRDKFGLFYTQDESYYILDADETATVYLGLKSDADLVRMFEDLEEARSGNLSFDAAKYINEIPAKRHDHFLIPAGTIHCSGSGSMVLEISATPYIFTFKLWDWDRLGLDGLPRPINLAHGQKNIQAERRTDWVTENLVNHLVTIGEGEGWREERTGLHPLEFIETRRHWFTGTVMHHTEDTVNVLNLVQGREAVVESPIELFAPFTVHFAETFIVPAAVGPYTIRPCGESAGEECVTMKAFVRLNSR